MSKAAVRVQRSAVGSPPSKQMSGCRYRRRLHWTYAPRFCHGRTLLISRSTYNTIMGWGGLGRRSGSVGCEGARLIRRSRLVFGGATGRAPEQSAQSAQADTSERRSHSRPILFVPFRRFRRLGRSNAGDAYSDFSKSWTCHGQTDASIKVFSKCESVILRSNFRLLADGSFPVI